MTEKSLHERTSDRLAKQLEEMAANFGNTEWWVNYYGGQEKYDEIMALAEQTSHVQGPETPEEIEEWARAGAVFICGGPDDDVEQWGRDVVTAANEETLRQEAERKNVGKDI